MKLSMVLLILLSATAFGQKPAESLIDSALSDFHSAAATGDWDNYFRLLSEDSIFLGTDATERWSKTAFEGFARKTQGWVYTLKERHINLTPDGNSAWFDELLWNESYGLCRGTGVLIKQGESWLISQYHLTIPIPNEIAGDVVTLIKKSDSP